MGLWQWNSQWHEIFLSLSGSKKQSDKNAYYKGDVSTHNSKFQTGEFVDSATVFGVEIARLS